MSLAGPILYEINTRIWLRELSEKAGTRLTLGDVPESEIEKWKAFGFTHIWLMGVWQVGPKAREIALGSWREYWRNEVPSTEEDVQGSPFAIQEYAVDARLGDALSLLMFKERLGRAGLRLIVDFVPNHLGIDSTEASRFPARFVHSDDSREGTFTVEASFGKRYFAHGRDPYFAPWSDTVQLDYRVLETQQAMMAAAQTVSMFGDGLRCDMAMLLLPEIFEETWKSFPSAGIHQTMKNFWRQAIPAVRQLQPQAELIAEVYWDREIELQELGFDYTYNKRVCDYLLRRQDGELIEFLRRIPLPVLKRSVHFLENHDEARVASVLPLERHKISAALILFLPGMALLHDGQLEGREYFARIQMSRRRREEMNAPIAEFYAELLRVLQATHVRRGKPALLFGDHVLAVKWEGAEEIDVGMVNLDDQEGRLSWSEPIGEHSILWRSSTSEVQLKPGVFIIPAVSACIVRIKRNS